MTVAIHLIILVSKLRVLIIVNVIFVNIQQISLRGDEVPPGAVLALLVHLVFYAQQFRHLVLVVDQVSPFQPGLEHDLQSVARCRDVGHHDANLLQVEVGDDLLPVVPDRTAVMGVHHVVDIHHAEPVQTYPVLLPPAADNTLLVRKFQIVGYEDDQWQLSLHPVAERLHLLLVSQLVHCSPSFRLQPTVPVLVIICLQPFRVITVALDLPHQCHLHGHLRVSQQREEELVSHILCGHTEISLITKRHII